MALNKQIDQMLADGVISPSTSAWSSPVVLTPKQGSGGSELQYRLCCDFQQLNSVTVFYAYLMKSIDETFKVMFGAKVWILFDVKSAFWQIPIIEEDKNKTAIICEKALFYFNVVPFGVKNGSAVIQRTCEKALGDCVGRKVEIYADNMEIFSKDMSTNLHDVREVLRKFRENNLTLNPAKCVFGIDKHKCLGYVISAKGVIMHPDKVQVMSDCASPQNKKELERFLGLAGWYANFIPNFADSSSPLNNLRFKDKLWDWSEKFEESFQMLKQKLISPEVLACPDLTKPFQNICTGIGCSLNQLQNGKFRPVSYASRKLKPAERNFSPTEGECLAVVWSLEKWRP